MSEILYRSRDVEVRRVAGGCDGSRQVVTFHSYHEGNGLDHPGFGQVYLAREQIPAVHVLCRGNDWYQYAEMPAVTAAIRDATRGADRIVTYGTSMGGYAAIRFAGAIGAHAALAISPQYSVDRRKIRAETRWLEDQRRIRFRPEIDGRIAFQGRVILVYDPELALDRQHAALFAADVPVDSLPLPHAGHPASTYLYEIGMLQPLVRAVVADRLDLPAFVEEAARRAERSPAYLVERSLSLPAAEAIAMAAQAAALAPDAAYVLAALGDRYAAARQWHPAIEARRRAVELDSSPTFRWPLADLLRAAGAMEEALAVTRTLQQDFPHLARYHRSAAHLRRAMGDIAGARAELRTAIACAPAHYGLRWLALRLRGQALLDGFSAKR